MAVWMSHCKAISEDIEKNGSQRDQDIFTNKKSSFPNLFSQKVMRAVMDD